jgi:hypothetical protein
MIPALARSRFLPSLFFRVAARRFLFGAGDVHLSAGVVTDQ